MADSENDSTQLIVIRKYPNRRYYDTTRSQHVTLEEIHTLIRDGYDIQVTDSKTGTDITAKVLAQIILELDPPKLDIFPVPLMHRLIRANEGIIRDFIEKYFNHALSTFLDSQRQFEQYLRQSFGLAGGAPAVPPWAGLMLNPLARAMWPGAGSVPTAPPASAGVPEDSQRLRAQVEELQKQLSALQQHVAGAEDPGSPG